MSYQSAEEPKCTETKGSVELVIRPKEKDLGEFTVRRVLPAPEKQMVAILNPVPLLVNPGEPPEANKNSLPMKGGKI